MALVEVMHKIHWTKSIKLKSIREKKKDPATVKIINGIKIEVPKVIVNIEATIVPKVPIIKLGNFLLAHVAKCLKLSITLK